MAVAAVWEPDVLLKSLYATIQNGLYGTGRWGYSLVILALLVLICAVAVRGGELIFLRFPVIGFVPLEFLLAYFREIPYRASPADSLNRMWIHIGPLAILFVVAVLNLSQWRSLPALSQRKAEPKD